MSDPLTELHNDVRALLERQLDMVAAQASTNTKIDLLTSRLYNDGDGGAIPTLFKRAKEVDDTVAGLARAISNQRAYAMGAGAVVGGAMVVVRHLAAKLGFNF